MERFSILTESSTTGYHEHLRLDSHNSIDSLLAHRKIVVQGAITRNELKTLLKQNSSLRVGIGWSFESIHHFFKIMKECEGQVMSKYPTLSNYLIESDTRCDWFGFSKFNTFDEIFYQDFTADGLLKYNTLLLDFQESVIRFVVNHEIYRYHAILRDDRYRFEHYKKMRRNPSALEDGFRYYITAIREISGLSAVPREFIEEYLGCHYLHHPEVFFELLDFHTLKGDIYE